MIKVAHMADFHLDSPMALLKDAKMSAQRREEMVESVLAAIDRCLLEKVDIVLMAGDLFESATPNSATCKRLMEKMAWASGLLFFIAPGNHDYVHAASPYCRMAWPENVKIFLENRMEKVSLANQSICVWGAAFTAPSMETPLLKDFCVEDPGIINIGVLHGEVTGSDSSPYRPISIGDIEKSCFDYLALGHTHGFTGIQRAGSCSYGYCGCLEGRGFDELGERGFVIAEVDKEERRFYFCPMSRRQYIETTVDVSGLSKTQDICAAILEKTGEGSENLFKIRLTGGVEGSDIVDIGRLAGELEGKYYFFKLLDETELPEEYYKAAKEKTLTGLFVADLLEKIKNETDLREREKWEIALKMGYRALTGREVELL